MPYHRTCFDSEFDWVFEGIDDKILGDFGLAVTVPLALNWIDAMKN